MRKFLLVLSVLWLNACVTYVQPSVVAQQKYDILQQRVFVRVVNNISNCAPVLDLETDKGIVKTGLEHGGSYTVVLARDHDIGPAQTTLHLTVKARKDGVFLGSYDQPYSVDSYITGRHEVWEVNYINFTSDGWKVCQR